MPRTHVTDLLDWDAVKRDPVEFAKQLPRTPTGDRVIPHPAQEEILRCIQLSNCWPAISLFPFRAASTWASIANLDLAKAITFVGTIGRFHVPVRK